MSNNDKIEELKELYSTAYQLNIGMIQSLNGYKHLNEVYFKAYKHFKKLNAHIFSDDVQIYVEEINEFDKDVDKLLTSLQANIIETKKMETYLLSPIYT